MANANSKPLKFNQPFSRPQVSYSTNFEKIHSTIELKIAMFNDKIMAAHQPTYLYNSLVPACSLHCSDNQLVQMPYMNTNFGQHSFSYFHPIYETKCGIIKASPTVATYYICLNLSSFVGHSLTQSMSVHLASVSASNLRFPLYTVHVINRQSVIADFTPPECGM